MTESISPESSGKPPRLQGARITSLHPLEIIVYGNLACMLLIVVWQLTNYGQARRDVLPYPTLEQFHDRLLRDETNCIPAKFRWDLHREAVDATA